MISKVKIGSCFYDVVFIDKPLFVKGSEVRGVIDYNNCTIHIGNEFKGRWLQILFHEIMHGIKYEYGINFDDDESLCDAFANGVMELFRNNKELYELLMVDRLKERLEQFEMEDR